MSRGWSIALEFKPQDLWVGLFWKASSRRVDAWLCLIPCVPIHVSWRRHGCCANPFAGNPQVGDEQVGDEIVHAFSREEGTDRKYLAIRIGPDVRNPGSAMWLAWHSASGTLSQVSVGYWWILKPKDAREA